MACAGELVALLTRLGLARYLAQFEEEAITELQLLTSMGVEMLRENLEELGMDAEDIATLSTALFPEEAEEEDGLMLEDNVQVGSAAADAKAEVEAEEDEDAALQLESNAPEKGPEADHEADHADLVAAAADADWMDKPLAVLDPPEAKRKFLAIRKEAHHHFRRGQYANAAAAYTHALALEVPNAQANASALYNRAACRRHLGQLHQAMQDAQLAAAADPTMVGAWWRAADAALALGDAATAAEVVAAGLKVEPSAAPLLELRLRVQAAGAAA